MDGIAIDQGTGTRKNEVFRGFYSVIQVSCIVVEIRVATYQGDINEDYHVTVIEQSTSMLHLILFASFEDKIIIFPSFFRSTSVALSFHFSIYYRHNTHNCIEH